MQRAGADFTFGDATAVAAAEARHSSSKRQLGRSAPASGRKICRFRAAR
jgi:hypothetical protein